MSLELVEEDSVEVVATLSFDFFVWPVVLSYFFLGAFLLLTVPWLQ